jgi:hypothetical protein
VGQRPKKDQVQFFLIFFYGVFELPSPRITKNVVKEIEKKSVLDFWSIFL